METTKKLNETPLIERMTDNQTYVIVDDQGNVSRIKDVAKEYITETELNDFIKPYDERITTNEINITNQETYINITYEELKDAFSENLGFIDNSLFVNNKYVLKNGDVAEVSGLMYIEIDVNPFESYYVDFVYLTSGFGTSQPVYLFKNDDGIVDYVIGADVTLTDDNKYKGIIEIPYNVNKLIINASSSNNIINRSVILKVDNYKIMDIDKEQLSDKLQSIFTDVYQEVEPSIYVNNALMSPTRVDYISGYNIYSYDVNPGEKYKINGVQVYNNPLVAFANSNSQKEYDINGVPYIFDSIVSTIQGNSGEVFTNYEFTIPDYCKKIYINNQNKNTLKLEKSISYKVKSDDIDLINIENLLNPLSNKKMLFVGDSICAASTTGVKGWWRLIQENNPTATIYNYGKDGATIAENGNNDNVISRKIETMYSEHPEADYIIIEGGVNDLWQNIPLGTFEENGNFNAYTPYDKTTFSGALEYILHYALTHFKGKKIGYIVTHKIHQASGFEDYMEQARKICKKWSIPYIDLFNEGCMNYLIEQQRQDFSITTVVSTGDGCHPNLAGYQIITPKIESWLKTL